MKKRLLFFTTFIITAFCFNIDNVYAHDVNNYRYRNLCANYELAGFHTDGYIATVGCYANYTDAKNAMVSNGADDLAIMTKVNGQTKIIDANLGILDLSVNPETLTYFYEQPETDGRKYTYMDTGSAYGGVDGAHIETYFSGTYGWNAKVKIGNFTGWIRQSTYEIVPITWIKSTSSYTVTNEDIRHNYVAKIQEEYYGSGGRTIGPKPEMLSEGTYYSYDGHYFYKDIKTLIKDYKAGNFNNAVNKDNEYYNYYMYLSNHTKTNYSSINIDEYIRNYLNYNGDVYGTTAGGEKSRLYGMGTFFYNAQEKYGVNAILSLSLSRNETGNGRSNLAINKNNGFGLNAVDSSPTESSNWYATFSSSILGYADRWITRGYAHPSDWRYFGPQFGDKGIGMNVKYASDTYWSEKMAANYYALDKTYGLQDYNYYQLGVVKEQVVARRDSSNSSPSVYTYPEKEDTVVIIGEKEGQEVDGNTKWYKVVSDLNIDSNYNEKTSGNYNWEGYVYLPASKVKLINKAKNGYQTPNDVTEYQDAKYEYDLLVEYREDAVELKPKLAISLENTPYHYDPTLLSKTGATLLKDRYVMVYTIAYDENKEVVSYLVTSDYWSDQKHWVDADKIKFISGEYGRAYVTVPNQNCYTWVNSTTQDTQSTLISGLYTYTFVPVLEKKTVDGYLWYKVPVNLTGTNNEFGWTLASAPNVEIRLSKTTVANMPPVISAKDITLVRGTKFEELKDVTATDNEDGNLTDKIIVLDNTVNTDVVGEYIVKYQVTDSGKEITIKEIKVIVTENKKPVIDAKDITTTLGKEKPNLLDGVSATDEEDGKLTEIIVDDSNVNYDEVGEYKVIYKVVDSYKQESTKEIKLTITESQSPVINATDKSITINTTFDPKVGVTATDAEDGDLTDQIKIIKNTVKEKEIGTYEVTYQVTDKNNKTTEKTIKVTVVDKTEKEGTFYFDYLNEIDNKLSLRGYLTISGMNNTLDEKITYKVILTNTQDKTKVYEQDATRIEDLTGINRPIYSTDGFKYTHAWFNAEIDINKLPEGNYTMEIQAEGKEYFSRVLVNNKLYKTQVSSYSSDEKMVNIKNNYSDRTSAVTLYVRKKETPKKTVGNYYNQYDIWRIFEFVDNKLHLKGASYSYGMDLSKDKKVERKLIFENKETYETHEYDLGSTTEGLYNVALPVSDNLDKTRAWYDATLDITTLPKGKYRLYITTTSNVTDYSEFTDNLGRDLSKKKITIDDKTYQFSLNLTDGNCIELEVS